MPVATSAEPTAAERIRSVLAAAQSLDVVASCGRARLTGRHDVDGRGLLTLRLPGDSRLAQTAARAVAGVPVVAEFTDIAPIAMPHRVRAQVSLNGVLSLVGYRYGADADAAGTVIALVRISCAQLIEGSAYTLVTADDLARAATDPVAHDEASWLTHLVDAHPGVIDLLTRLIAPRALHGVYRAQPLRLDRFGIVLRLERPRSHQDVRLRFPTPLRCRADAADQVRALLQQARTCRRRRDLRAGSGER
jgi:hypothetical protein